MLTLRDEEEAAAVPDPLLRELLVARLADLSQGDAYDPEVHGLISVMEPGDTVADAESAAGAPLLTNPITGAEYGQQQFSPVFEYVGRHDGWYEIVVIPGDGDFGQVLFIPCHASIDRRLLALCAAYAVSDSAEV